ncbi:MAG: hypothetical protein B7Y98_12970 [Sphingomonas sp. 32-62-10]|nr:MAG: hypothetical protein B7Z43_08410 [Sphingomonas sp. 12-62-6]OYX37205.1 MAG: hypothetical protein B7Y98_12970 [Sphingomonas sp. 32-62-10]
MKLRGEVAEVAGCHLILTEGRNFGWEARRKVMKVTTWVTNCDGAGRGADGMSGSKRSTGWGCDDGKERVAVLK